MTDKEINIEAEKEYERYHLICKDKKDAWMKAYILAHKAGQIEGITNR